jgi:quinoprotein glucose dehydrogenase
VKRILIVAGLLYASVVGVVAGAPGAGSRAPADIDLRSGVYTTRQAERGGSVYVDNCARCHGENLETGEGASVYGIPSPPLAGKLFLAKWKDRSLGELFTLIQTTMPKNVSVKLNPAEYADVLAFVLQQNEFPEGKMELTADINRLMAIKVTGQP